MHIQSNAKKKVILIFGGLGFIGYRVAESLSEQYTVHVVDNCFLNDRSADVLGELERRRTLLVSKGVTVHSLDVSSLKKALCDEAIETVYHMAGNSSVKSAYKKNGYENTLGITNRILSHLNEYVINRVIYFSSSMVYGDFQSPRVSESHAKNPVDSYGAYKYASEILVKSWCFERSITSIILRPTAVYGPNDIHKRVVSRFINQASKDGVMTVIGNGESKLDFTYVEDVVPAAKAAAELNKSDEFNISFGQGRSLNDLTGFIQKAYPNARISHNFVPNHPTARRGTLCSDKAMRILGYEPRFPLELGLDETLRAERSGKQGNSKQISQPILSIPLSRPDLISSDFDRVSSALQSGWLTTGAQNKLFQEKFINYLKPAKQSYALTVNSCASALILALRAAGITGEVLVPAFTFSATANAIELAGATPKFIDIEPYTLGIDPEKLTAAINQNTQAILVVHLAGVCCDIEAILNVAKQNNLIVIEDCAQALGAEYNGIKAGSFGHISCFSFFPTKMITTGEGGMLVTSNRKYFENASALANHGYGSSTLDRETKKKPWEREQLCAGFNFRMSNINAALGVAQMDRIEGIVGHRRSKALYLINLLKHIDGISFFEYPDRVSVYQALNILVSEDIDRDEFVLALRSSGVMASVHYPDVLSNSDIFKRHSISSDTYPVSQNIAQNIVTLPMFGAITKLQMKYIVKEIEQTLEAIRPKFLKDVI